MYNKVYKSTGGLKDLLLHKTDGYNLAYPIISFQHGTQIRRESAPSMNGFNDLILWLTTSGYIFIEPDYLGLGDSEGMHPYQLKEPYGTAVVDMLRAVWFYAAFENEQFVLNDQLFLAGYSEGG